MERLTKRASNGLPYLAKVKDSEQDIYSDYRNTLACVQEAFKKLAEYEDAEEQGLLVKLPCKTGDTLYDIYEFIENRCSPDITEYKAKSIEVGEDKKGRWFCIDSTIFRPEDFGKTVFLTREEAEAALKGSVSE